MEKYQFGKEDDDFYKQAAKKIYDWLPEEKKTKLGSELSSEGISSIDLLDSDKRFFRLMHFLELNFIKPVEWATESVQLFDSLVLKNKLGHGQIPSVDIQLLPEVNLRKISELLSESQLKQTFLSTLESIQVVEEYRSYFPTEKEDKSLE